LLSETVVVMHWNVGNCTAKRANINKFYKADLTFVIICKNSASGRTNCPAVPGLYVHLFSRYIISVFHNLVKVVQRATLWTGHLRTVQHKTSQHSLIQNDTTHWTSVCSVLWLQPGTGKVQAKYCTAY